MARRKKMSSILVKCENRLLGIKSIDAKIDLGGGITVAAFEKDIVSLRQQLEAYNISLAKADAASNEIIKAEKALATIAERMLTGIATRFGKASNEYEMAGGSRRGDRPRRRPNPPAPISAPESATV